MKSDDPSGPLLSDGAGYLIRVRGHTDSGPWDFVCDLIERSAHEVVLRTRSDPPHVIEINPRHVGVKLGDKQVGDATICQLSLDGGRFALGDYYEYPRGILVVPQDYEPLWVYEMPEADQEQLAAEIEAIRQMLKRGPTTDKTGNKR